MVGKCCPSLCVSVVAAEGLGKPKQDSLFTNIAFRMFVLSVSPSVLCIRTCIRLFRYSATMQCLKRHSGDRHSCCIRNDTVFPEDVIVSDLVNEFSPFLNNPKVIYSVYTCPPLVSVRSHTTAVHILRQSFFFKGLLRIAQPPTRESFEVASSFLQASITKFCVHFSPLHRVPHGTPPSIAEAVSVCDMSPFFLLRCMGHRDNLTCTFRLELVTLVLQIKPLAISKRYLGLWIDRERQGKARYKEEFYRSRGHANLPPGFIIVWEYAYVEPR